MKLGIHVISDRHLDDIVGIAKAAASKRTRGNRIHNG